MQYFPNSLLIVFTKMIVCTSVFRQLDKISCIHVSTKTVLQIYILFIKFSARNVRNVDLLLSLCFCIRKYLSRNTEKYGFTGVCHSVHGGDLCMMSLPVWLLGPMFLLGVSVSGSMFFPGHLCPWGLCLVDLCRESLSRGVSVRETPGQRPPPAQ